MTFVVILDRSTLLRSPKTLKNLKKSSKIEKMSLMTAVV